MLPDNYDQTLRAEAQRRASGASLHWVMNYLDLTYYRACKLEEKHKDDPVKGEFRRKVREECERVIRKFIVTGQKPEGE